MLIHIGFWGIPLLLTAIIVTYVWGRIAKIENDAFGLIGGFCFLFGLIIVLLVWLIYFAILAI